MSKIKERNIKKNLEFLMERGNINPVTGNLVVDIDKISKNTGVKKANLRNKVKSIGNTASLYSGIYVIRKDEGEYEDSKRRDDLSFAKAQRALDFLENIKDGIEMLDDGIVIDLKKAAKSANVHISNIRRKAYALQDRGIKVDRIKSGFLKLIPSEEEIKKPEQPKEEIKEEIKEQPKVKEDHSKTIRVSGDNNKEHKLNVTLSNRFGDKTIIVTATSKDILLSFLDSDKLVAITDKLLG